MLPVEVYTSGYRPSQFLCHSYHQTNQKLRIEGITYIFFCDEKMDVMVVVWKAQIFFHNSTLLSLILKKIIIIINIYSDSFFIATGLLLLVKIIDIFLKSKIPSLSKLGYSLIYPETSIWVATITGLISLYTSVRQEAAVQFKTHFHFWFPIKINVLPFLDYSLIRKKEGV